MASWMTYAQPNCLAEWCLQETQVQGSLDKNDPNYDSEEDKTVSYHSQKTLQIKLYKKAVGRVRVQWGVRKMMGTDIGRGPCRSSSAWMQ